MSREILKQLNKLYKHVEYYNKMAPFPPFCTEWQQNIRDKINEIKMEKKDYDKEPVIYCATCLSLSIIDLKEQGEFCDKCGSTHVEQTDIETWKDMYKKKYGIDFVNNKPLKK